jgi:hypothetical protein
MALVPAAALVVVHLVHLHRCDIDCRSAADAFALALSRMVIVLLGSTLLMVGTIVGFILGDTVGPFGFTLPEVTGWADLALVAEALSTVALAVVLVRQAHLVEPVGPA